MVRCSSPLVGRVITSYLSFPFLVAAFWVLFVIVKLTEKQSKDMIIEFPALSCSVLLIHLKTNTGVIVQCPDLHVLPLSLFSFLSLTFS